MKYSLLTAAAITAVLAATPALADEDIAALKTEIKKLEARLDQLEKKEKAQAQNQTKAQTTTTASAPVNKPLAQRVTALEQKESQEPTVNVGSNGLLVTSPDKQYQLGVHAYAQFDARTFFDKGANNATGANNNFLVRTARPIINAKMTDYFDGRLMWDFGQGNSRLLDAYGDFHPMPGNDLLNFRAGQFKTPVGLERWESEQDLEFTERSFTTNLVPYRDTGAMAYGQLIPKQLEYQLAYVNGASDLQINTGDTNSNKDVDVRLFAHPLYWTDVKPLQGFGIGLAGTYGNHQGSSSSPNITTGYLTAAQRTFFTYSSGVYANGPQWRLNPQLMYYYGPFGAFGEYVRDAQELKVSSTDHELQNNAWFASASYVLTGENASFDGVKPKEVFNPKTGNWGAFELVGRYGQLKVDNDAFPLFANIASSARHAYETVLGINWYLNNSVKLNLDYAYTTFDGGAASGDRTSEKALLARTQIRF